MRRRVPRELQRIVDGTKADMDAHIRKFSQLEIPARDQQYDDALKVLERIAREALAALPANAPPACKNEIGEHLERALMRLGPPPPRVKRLAVEGTRRRKPSGRGDTKTSEKPRQPAPVKVHVSGSYAAGALRLAWAWEGEKVDEWRVVVRADKRRVARRVVRGGARQTIISRLSSARSLYVRVDGHRGKAVAVRGFTTIVPDLSH
jgi:hypothetical protein